MDLLTLLVLLLGHDDFRQREAAHKTLLAIGPTSLPFVTQLEKHPDTEIAQRAWAIADAHLLTMAKGGRLFPAGWTALPWCSSVPHCYGIGGVNYSSAARVQGASTDYAPDWPAWRAGTALLIGDLIREGWTGHAIRDLLEEMAAMDRKWCVGNNARCLPDGRACWGTP